MLRGDKESPLLSLLRSRKPKWFTINLFEESPLCGVATIKEFGRSAQAFRLRITETHWNRAAVVETSGRLPAGCPERHINFASSWQRDFGNPRQSGEFCLGYGDAALVNDALSATTWWSTLREFLANQLVFDRAAIWPIKYALDHGDAARFHKRELALAAELGLLEVVNASFLDQPCFLNDPTFGVVDQNGRLKNRGLCPCTKCPEGTALRDCSWTNIGDLVKIDLARKKARREYYLGLARDGHKCCGALPLCPLA